LKQNPNRPFLKDAWIFPDVLSETQLGDEELKAEFENGSKIRARNLNYLGSKSHSVTYRRIEAHAVHATTFQVQESDGRWLLPAELNQIHTSSIVKKILQLL
jgi:adenine-specific DNA glycosylase